MDEAGPRKQSCGVEEKAELELEFHLWINLKADTTDTNGEKTAQGRQSLCVCVCGRRRRLLLIAHTLRFLKIQGLGEQERRSGGLKS